MSDRSGPPIRADIDAAAVRLDALVRHTPVLDVDPRELGVAGLSAPLTLKLEQLQHAGSFKARGALNALLTSPAAADGVVAASGGNHGVAVAWAARRLSLPADIFVPEIAAPAKIRRLEQLGARVHQHGAQYSESLAAAEQFAATHDVVSVHAYDQFEVMAGAGTVARELDDQRPDIDTVLVACGGGGLAGGLACWWGQGRRLVVVETSGTPTLARALASGGPVDVEVRGIGADALGARRLGALGWAALTAGSVESVLVEDDDVSAAQTVLWEECRLRVEPAGAAALAALRSGAVDPSGLGRTAVIVCGANTG